MVDALLQVRYLDRARSGQARARALHRSRRSGAGPGHALAAAFVNLLSYPPDTFIFSDAWRWYVFYNNIYTAALIWLGPAAGWLGRLLNGGINLLAWWPRWG